ncbi:MAG: NADH:ubiquinone reductase (Na(+)-transporting) subunit C [Bacteroidales bacterium]|nr:NADH:ubiquinone reductase (Na(+)-transporting) subunit C [Bacteroidales bacterium]
MKTFSNKYIFVYVSVLVLVVAVLLTAVSLGLKPRQEANRKAEKAAQILRAAGYHDVDGSEAVALFEQVAQRASGDGERETYHIRCADGENGLVVYVNGKGLWGAIWGYVVLAEDLNTVKGIVFSHKSETPGLGANITEEKFSSAFVGKKLYDEKGNFVSVRVLKAGQGSDVPDVHRVDAISGATLTSKGVDAMLMESLPEVIAKLKTVNKK